MRSAVADVAKDAGAVQGVPAAAAAADRQGDPFAEPLHREGGQVDVLPVERPAVQLYFLLAAAEPRQVAGKQGQAEAEDQDEAGGDGPPQVAEVHTAVHEAGVREEDAEDLPLWARCGDGDG